MYSDTRTKNNMSNMVDVNTLTSNELTLSLPSQSSLPSHHVTDRAFVVVGNVDSGKSTVIGTLISDLLDDGRGVARKCVARHKHEIDSGKTSDISSRSLKFPDGKSVTMIDLCGHENYAKTTVSGISGMWPDYGIVVVSPHRGVLDMTKYHFRMLMTLNIPVMIVITRADVSLKDSYDNTIRELNTLCVNKYKRKIVNITSYASYESIVEAKELIKTLNVIPPSKVTPITDILAKGFKLNALGVNKKIVLDDVKVSEPKKVIGVMTDTGFKLTQEDIERYDLTKKQIDLLQNYFNFDQEKDESVKKIVGYFDMATGKQVIIPIIYISNVTGYYLDVLKRAIADIKPRNLWDRVANSSIVKNFRKFLEFPETEAKLYGSIFYVDQPWTVIGHGIVVSGINRGDRISVGDIMYIGPTRTTNKVKIGTDQTNVTSNYITVKIRSIRTDDNVNIQYLDHHHRGTICIKPIKDELTINQIKRGAVLVSQIDTARKYTCYHFNAVITIFGGHTTTLTSGYSPVLHAGNIRQTVKLIIPNDDDSKQTDNDDLSGMTKRERKTHVKHLKSGDFAKVLFKFKMHPEFLPPTIFIFRSGDLHGVGYAYESIELSDDADAKPEPIKKRYRGIKQNKPKIEKSVIKK
jgi:GTPase